MTAAVRQLAPPIAEERVRVLPGLAGPIGPVWIIGLSVSGHPLIRCEVPLEQIEDAASMVRSYLRRRDLGGQR